LYFVKNQTVIVLSKRASFIFDVCLSAAPLQIKEQESEPICETTAHLSIKTGYTF